MSRTKKEPEYIVWPARDIRLKKVKGRKGVYQAKVKIGGLDVTIRSYPYPYTAWLGDGGGFGASVLVKKPQGSWCLARAGRIGALNAVANLLGRETKLLDRNIADARKERDYHAKLAKRLGGLRP